MLARVPNHGSLIPAVEHRSQSAPLAPAPATVWGLFYVTGDIVRASGCKGSQLLAVRFYDPCAPVIRCSAAPVLGCSAALRWCWPVLGFRCAGAGRHVFHKLRTIAITVLIALVIGCFWGAALGEASALRSPEPAGGGFQLLVCAPARSPAVAIKGPQGSSAPRDQALLPARRWCGARPYECDFEAPEWPQSAGVLVTLEVSV